MGFVARLLFVAQLQWEENNQNAKNKQTQTWMSKETNDQDTFDWDTIVQDANTLVMEWAIIHMNKY